MKLNEIIFNIILVLVVCVVLLFFNMGDVRFTPLIIASVIFFILVEKVLSKIHYVTKGILIIVFLFLYTTVVDLDKSFHPYQKIVRTTSRVKVDEIEKFIMKRSLVGVGLHIHKKDTKDEYFEIELKTTNRRIFDKLALELIQSDLYDDTVDIGIFYYPPMTDDLKEFHKGLEKVFNKRFKMIKGVESVNTKIIFAPSEENADSNLTKIKVDIKVDANVDKDKIYKIVDRSLNTINKNKNIINITN